MKRSLVFCSIAALALASAPSFAAERVSVKKAIADRLSPEELRELEARNAELLRQRAASQFAASVGNPLVPADSCPAATPESGTFPYNDSDTTVGRADDYDLPADTTAPTCTASTSCVGGPSGRGNIYTNTGTGPDFAYSIEVDQNCSLSITMDPTGAQDLGLIVYQETCSNLLSDCVCVDDTGIDGVAEVVTLDAVAGTTYFLVVDGYQGASGPFDLSISETTATGCQLAGGCTLTCPANVAVNNDPAFCGAVVNYTAPTTSGTCGAVTCDTPSGSFFGVGTTTVTCTDAMAGAQCTFDVTVTDAQPPVFAGCTDIDVEIGDGDPDPVVNYGASPSDNCPGVVSNCAPPSGSTFPVGTTAVNCTATDASANTGVCGFNVNVAIGGSILEIPTLAPAGILLLASGLVGGGLLALRRRRRNG